ncbi:TolB family protein [Aureibaculum luteum]|uniref:TolB family protein n=1 Tax=Aureibaculum luteum TaxID=1548456 RepID=UPI000E532A58|nr:PD40 domain-containing protein [Aureibaculum luteum]
MKIKILCLLLTVTSFGFSQTDTDIYLFDFIQGDSILVIDNPINISDNKGYDNQPSFLNDGSGVLYASTRNEQTDIALYDIKNNVNVWLTNTEANEYSPIQTFDKNYFTAVRLEQDGEQLLWKYKFNGKKQEVLIENLPVGYHAWISKKMLVSFVIGDPSSLEVSNLKYKIKYPIDKNIGRSILKIPNTDLLSIISLEHEDPEIYSINPITSEKKYIADPLEGAQDLAWTPDGTMIMGKGDKLYKLKPGVNKTWVEFASLSSYGLKGITRLAISPFGNKLAIVVDETTK